ncbi:acetyltransferase [Enterococcus silesiacus]|uniref:Acetyltransferase n=1 Tax=Enterococcus silesiacus TaxID=332949 RepID=A0A0S3KAD8_9ENTE|nr:GNAT family N-acetyltransferase [Enterococcus silesiacus]ALS01281.1 acetyltransferase [Enterococcus silesiacus]OJG90673.1 hypothetical protein RV15_GL001024 [Enterococcus silesiacus]
MVIYLRTATAADLPEIMQIIYAARRLLEKNKVPQWQNGEGPNVLQLEQDIARQQCYLLIVDQHIAGLGIISTDKEAPYEQIKKGQWLETTRDYAVLHRVALAPAYQGKGLALTLMNFLVTVARLSDHLDIRIDTHPQNIAMQQLVKKAGFVYRGDILLPVPDGERVAYQLILS